MDIIVTILLVLLGLFSVGLVMYVTAKEKREHDAHHSYVRSPWPEEPVVPSAHSEVTEAEAVVVEEAGAPGAHTPVTSDGDTTDKQ